MDPAITELPPITMVPVTSSQITAIGHCPETNRMAIQFPPKKDGSVALYHYENITPEQFAALRNAESVGSHFYKHIKPFPDLFPFVKVT